MIVSETRGGFSLAPTLAVLKRRKYMLALPTLAAVAIGMIGYAKTPSSFVSEAVIALDVRRIQALPTETVVSPLPQESPALRTQLDIINSRSMAAKVVGRLEREGIEIPIRQDQSVSISRLLRMAGAWLHASAQPATEPTETSDLEKQKIDALLSSFSVTNDGRSYTIFLSFTSPDNVFAAKAANAYAVSYLDHQIESQREATRRVSDWLGETLISLRAGLEESEKAVEDFRQKAGLAETDGTTLQAQRVSALNAELALARAELAGAEARLATIRSLPEQEGIPALSEVLGSETIRELRIEQARLERRVRELRDNKAFKSTELTSIESELASLKEQLAAEVGRIIDSLSNEVAIARQKAEGLEAAMRNAQEDLSEANHAEVALAQFEREAAANREIYQSFLIRYKQTIEQDGIAAPEAQIISLAEPSASPSKPSLAAWLLLSLGFGGSLAVAGTIFREATDRRPRLRQTLEEATGVPVVGALPRVKRKAFAACHDAGTTLGRTLSTLRKILRVVPARRSSLAVAVTSTFANEGKTALVMGLAYSAANVGMKAVVVDANLRDPGVASALGITVETFIDEIDGTSERVNSLLHMDPASGVCFIAARTEAVSAELLLASPRFAALIDDLKLRFDVVLIDTPGIEAAPDALDIAAAADRILFVVDFTTKHVQQVVASIRSLAACGHQPAGIVLNRVSPSSYPELVEQLLSSGSPVVEPQPPFERTARQTA